VRARGGRFLCPKKEGKRLLPLDKRGHTRYRSEGACFTSPPDRGKERKGEKRGTASTPPLKNLQKRGKASLDFLPKKPLPGQGSRGGDVPLLFLPLILPDLKKKREKLNNLWLHGTVNIREAALTSRCDRGEDAFNHREEEDPAPTSTGSFSDARKRKGNLLRRRLHKRERRLFPRTGRKKRRSTSPFPIKEGGKKEEEMGRLPRPPEGLRHSHPPTPCQRLLRLRQRREKRRGNIPLLCVDGVARAS